MTLHKCFARAMLLTVLSTGLALVRASGFETFEVAQAAERGAICYDGSNARYYLRRNTSSTDWLVWFSGGGGCFNKEECDELRDYPPGETASDLGKQEDIGEMHQLFHTTSAENPLWTYNMVYVAYCSQDFWMGDSEDNGVYFRGNVIFRSVLEDLNAAGLSGASRVVAGGDSAGMLGTMNNLKVLEEKLPSAAILELILDAQFFPATTPDFISTFDMDYYIAPERKQLCEVTYHSSPCCLQNDCMLWKYSTDNETRPLRVFIIQALNDPLGVGSNEQETLALYEDGTASTSDLLGLEERMIVFEEAVRREILVTSSRLDNAASRVSLSWFLPSCVFHPITYNRYCYRSSDTFDYDLYGFEYSSVCTDEGVGYIQINSTSNSFLRWDRDSQSWLYLEIDGVSLRDALYQWNNGGTVHLMDQCGDLNCNSYCRELTAVEVDLKFRSKLSPALKISIYVAMLALVVLGMYFSLTRPHTFETDSCADVAPSPLVASLDSRNQQDSENGQEELKIEFRVLSYSPSETPGARALLKGIFGQFKTGELNAILGVSGCGKTTFLDLLSGHRTFGAWEGELIFNGVDVSEDSDFRRTVLGYLQQNGSEILGTLTCLENLVYKLMLLQSTNVSKDRVALKSSQILCDALKLLEEVEILGAMNNRTEAISGGQRRRLELSLELATGSSIMFLDEPTTALDANTALTICRTFHKVVRNSGKGFVITVHQPRPEIYTLFDNVYYMRSGEMIVGGSHDTVR
eukprot:gene23678-28696_t